MSRIQQSANKIPSSTITAPFLPVLLVLSLFRAFSSQKPANTTKTKRLNKALRVLDLIAPKATVSQNPQSHLRIIEDFLQTNSYQLETESVLSRLDCANSTEFVPTKRGKMPDLATSNNRDYLFLLLQMHRDTGICSLALSSCDSSITLSQLHCLSIKTGVIADVYIGSSLITLYSKSGKLEDAYKVFDMMPVRNVVSWTAIISGFAQELRVDMCLYFYCRMRNSSLKPNDFTFTSLLSACTGSGSLWQGKSTHSETIKMGFDSYTQIANALISMYSRCGNIEEAFCIFESMFGKDIVSWNSMIAGLALHGLGSEAIHLFEEMERQKKVKPDSVTFLALLSSCRHSGLIEQAQAYFGSMVELGLKPGIDHYSCMVDLLGRAGFLEEARDLIKSMPLDPNSVVWGSLLSTSRLKRSVWIAIQAAEERLLLEPTCAATHVQLANLYASVGWWDHTARVRKLIKDRGLRMNPGCSWIEVEHEVYRFRAGDGSNNRMNEILIVMDNLLAHMTSLGYEHETLGGGDTDLCRKARIIRLQYTP